MMGIAEELANKGAKERAHQQQFSSPR